MFRQNGKENPSGSALALLPKEYSYPMFRGLSATLEAANKSVKEATEGNPYTPISVVQDYAIAVRQDQALIKTPHLREYSSWLMAFATNQPQASLRAPGTPNLDFYPEWMQPYIQFGWNGLRIDVFEAVKNGAFIAADVYPKTPTDPAKTLLAHFQRTESPWLVFPIEEPPEALKVQLLRVTAQYMTIFCNHLSEVDSFEFPAIGHRRSIREMLERPSRITYDELESVSKGSAHNSSYFWLNLLKIHQERMKKRLQHLTSQTAPLVAATVLAFNDHLPPVFSTTLARHLTSWPTMLAAAQSNELNVLDEMFRQEAHLGRLEPRSNNDNWGGWA